MYSAAATSLLSERRLVAARKSVKTRIPVKKSTKINHLKFITSDNCILPEEGSAAIAVRGSPGKVGPLRGYG